MSRVTSLPQPVGAGARGIPASDKAEIVEAPPSGVPSSLWVVVVVFALCSVLTLAIAETDSLRFAFRLPQARVPIEMVGIVVASMAAALAYFRYALTGARTFLFVALAFVAIGVNRLQFGVLGVDPGTMTDLDVYLWSAGRMVMGGLLLLGALPSGRIWRTEVRPVRDLLIGAVVSLWILMLGQWLLIANADRLPQLALGPTDPVSIPGWHPNLTAMDLTLALLGAAVFLVAATLYARPGTGTGVSLLAPALVLAAFAHVHYLLVPTIFSGWISTGDLLRLGFSIAVMVGLLLEVQRAYRAERDQMRELALAFAAERDRAQELEALDRTRAELLRMTTHELMHPVSVLRSWIVTLRRRWRTLDDERKLEILGTLDEECSRLVDIAERTPQMGGAGAQALIFPIVRRREGVFDLVNQASAAIGLDGALTVDIDPGAEHASVLADATRVLQVLMNLLSNAVKYSGPHPQVELWAHGSAPDVWFTVADRGPGIPAEDLERVFDLAYGAAPRSGHGATPSGSGLGLYICRRIVEAHGGLIWAERRPRGGTAITFTLPMAEDER